MLRIAFSDSDWKVFMTRAAIIPSEVDLTFLVSREGIATLSTSPIDADEAAQALPSAGYGEDAVEARRRSGIELPMQLGDTPAYVVKVSFGSAWPSIPAQPPTTGRVNGLKGKGRLKAYKTKAVEIKGSMAAIEGFTRVARSCLVQVSANAVLLHGVRNPEALHQIRVGLRRLRVAFATFQDILPREGVDRLELETKWISGELDPARDLDVFIDNAFNAAKAKMPDDAAMMAFGERLHLAQGLAYDQALVAVESSRFATLMLDCAEWVEAVPSCRSDTVVVSMRDGDAGILAARALKRLWRQLCKSGKKLDTLDAAGRHKVRIKAKKLRYAGEFFTETFGKSAHKRHLKYIASLTALQDTLGNLNDMATARRSAVVVAGRSAELAFPAGLVVGGLVRDEPRLLGLAVLAYEQWTNAKPFWN